ncbi:MAG: hypothetical protein WD894_16465 [Pirellulales bacterium]
MAAPLVRSLIAVACLLPQAAVHGQDRSQYVPATPTLSERMSQLRTNLFGGQPDDDQRSSPRAPSERSRRPANSKFEPRPAPTRPSQSNANNPQYGNAKRGYSGTMAMNGRATVNNARGQVDRSGDSPGGIDQDNIPALARRPLFRPTAGADSPINGAGSALLPSSAQTFSQRMGSVRQQNDVAPIDVSDSEAGNDPAVEGLADDRSGAFAPQGGISNRVQQILNPTVKDANRADNPLPSLARSSRPAVAGPVTAPASQPPAAASVTSSRRGFSPVSPTDRVASSLPQRSPPAASEDRDDVLFKRQSPLINIETTGPRTMIVGKEGAYTITVQNTGDVAANEVVVTVRIPDWADVVGSKESSGIAQLPAATSADANVSAVVATTNMNAVRWTLPRLEPKSKQHLSLQIVPRQSRPFDLAVQWTFTPITQSTVVQVQEPKLAMNLAGPADVLFGDTKIYKMTLSNPGTGDAENVVIHLSPLTGHPGAPTKHQIGTIKAGDSKVIEVELTARQAGQVVIHAAATAEGGLQAEVTEEVTVRRAELALKIVGAKARYAGTVASYHVEVVNSGNAPAEDVQVVAALPAGAKFLNATSGGQASADGAKVHWTIPTVRDGGNVVLELKCQVNNPGVNRLAVQSTAVGELSAATEDVCQVEALADLRLDVIEPKGPIAVGADVSYEIRLVNRGSKSASDVKVMGYFSGKIDPITATGGEHRLVPGIVIFKPIAALPPGGEAMFKITAVAKASGHHMFKAEVVCETAGAKLGSEHTTLFYGDEVADETHDEATTAEDSPRPLVPKTVFETDENATTSASDSSELAPAQQDQWASPLQNPLSSGLTHEPAQALENQPAPALSNQSSTTRLNHLPFPNQSTAPNQSTPIAQRGATTPNPSAAPNPFAPALQRAPVAKAGSAYLPGARSATSPAAIVPVSPFALRPTTKK